MIQFAQLPDDARVWVFASEHALDETRAGILLRAVDGFLTGWHAHGEPLRCARDWRDGMFLAIGVDQSTAGASGCSIDGLFRVLRGEEGVIGSRLLAGGTIYWRGEDGSVVSASRAEFAVRAGRGEVTGTTPVFDTSITTAAEWRLRFERSAMESWHMRYLQSGAER